MKKCSRCKKEKPLTNFHRMGLKDNVQQYSYYCKLCRSIKGKEWNKKSPEKLKNRLIKYRLSHPWWQTYSNIRIHCVYDKNHPYYNKIKNFLTLQDLKYLWFRDKAYLLRKPSIDRIETHGNYTVKNCRYIELSINQRRRKRKSNTTTH